MELTYDIAPFRERITFILDKLTASVETELWPEMADIFYEGEEEIFSSEGQSIGHHWPALTDRYLAWKQSHYPPGDRLMILTGALHDSLTQKSAPGSVYVLSEESLTLGSARTVTNKSGKQWNLGLIHQFRDRPTLGASDDTKEKWRQKVLEYLEMALAGP